MNRSGYSDDGCDDIWDYIRWRGAVTSAIRGKRGQEFLKEMLVALDALPERKLVCGVLETQDGAVCAMGAVGKVRHLDMSKIEAEDRFEVAAAFGISPALAAEIAFMNDEGGNFWGNEGEKERFERVRRWVEKQIKPEEARNES